MDHPKPGARIGAFLLRAESGTAGGLIAAVVVAVLFFVQGAITLHPLSVPAGLASGLFGGADSSGTGFFGRAGTDVAMGFEVVAYTVVHLLVFAAVGASAVLVVDSSTFWRSVIGGIAYAGATCTGLLYLVRWTVSTPVALDVVGLPRVLMANAVAGAIIGVSLHLAERETRRGRVAARR